MTRRLSKNSRDLLLKAIDSATQAVSTYNDPRSNFRTGNFTVLITIAWTSLLHSHFEKNKINYFYKKENGRYEIIDGEKKSWDLAESLKHVFEEEDPIRKNLELFIRLRNKIEHRSLPSLDPELIGECQAAVLNFEEWVIGKYGTQYSMMDTLFVPIQLTTARRILPRSKIEDNIISFIREYRGVLDTNTINSQKFAFKAYLVPKIGNHRSSSDMAIEFVKYDEDNPEEMSKYDKAIVAIKEKSIPVVNLGLYKPSQVISKLNDLGHKVSMNWHTEMWHKYKVRPINNVKNKTLTKAEYCIYDQPHGDYLYTDEWIKLLAKLLKK